MNAHHKKRSLRPTPPSQHEFFSCGNANLAHTLPKTEKAPKELRLWKAIGRVPLGWQFDVVLPRLGTSESKLPVELEEMVQSLSGFYYCPAVRLADLFVPAFMQMYMRKGSLIGISIGDGGSEQEAVCIDGRGRMVLSVSKDTYETLGLTGRKSAYGSLGMRHVIEIQLNNPGFRCGKPEVERVKASFNRWKSSANIFDDLPLTGLPADVDDSKAFDMLFAYVDEFGAAAPITFPPGIISHLRHPTFLSHQLSGVRVPCKFDPLFSPPEAVPRKKRRTEVDGVANWDAEQNKMREWIGCALAGVAKPLAWNATPSEFDEVAMGFEQTDCTAGSIRVMTWTGLFHPTTLEKLIKKVAKSDDSLFATFSLVPHPNCPISHLTTSLSVPTSKRPNGKKRKRGRGQGEEDEATPDGDEYGWTVLLKKKFDEEVQWCVWEGR